MSASKLTAKQRLFVAEYLTDFNATQAAIRAGYSRKTARFIGAENLTKPNIAGAIEEALEERLKALGVTSYRVLEELSKLGFSDIRNYVKWGSASVKLIDSDELGDEAAPAVAEVTQTPTQYGNSIKFKLHDKKGSLELLGKHLKLFTDKREHSGPDGGQISFTFDMARASGALDPGDGAHRRGSTDVR